VSGSGSTDATSEPIRLALVEDEHLTREVYAELLTARYPAAVEVVGFATVEELLDGEDERFDLVLLDLQLRDGCLQGSAAVEAVAQRYRVLVLSSLESGEALERAHTAGASGYVSKDTARMQTVIDAVRAVLAGDSYVDPELLAKIGTSARKQLSARQQEVLRHEALGQSDKQIAVELGLKPSGVRRHIEAIIRIYPDRAKSDRTRLAIELGLATPWEISRRYPDS
jgi:DNA-binding NarL/FixJ family response regulator